MDTNTTNAYPVDLLKLPVDERLAAAQAAIRQLSAHHPAPCLFVAGRRHRIGNLSIRHDHAGAVVRAELYSQTDRQWISLLRPDEAAPRP